MRTEDLVVGSVYAVRRGKYLPERLAVVIACDRQYGIWYDSYEKNYRLFEYRQGMLCDSRGVVVVLVPQEAEDELLSWAQAKRPVARFPAVEDILLRYEQLGDSLRGMVEPGGVRWSPHTLGDLIVVAPSNIMGNLSHYLTVAGQRRAREARRLISNGNAIAELKERFNAAFVPLTAPGVELDLIVDSPHGAHTRLSIEDMERLAEFVNKHSRRNGS